ncbi:histone-like nucleoid-structuring protein Lsr2 [Cryptosporangium arvum]|uniref:Lsr2 family protein n=1 Tax=Cryptosporangium arvum DSM 44712 TaxID=927661 RepID=A0A010ZS06_9ACTN|nr:Lsr2 family protein [Cryptosporangium arvum]EXG81444.1 Lsr2 family protein [Cryptosporangium arvum DSM 44712]
MARKVQVLLVDDVDGSTADETVSFGLDGANYEIDLSTTNATAFRESLAKYVESARKAGRGGTGKTGRAAGPAKPSPSADRAQNQAIRDWAKRNGLQVSERGRIPAEIIEKYHAAA